MEGTQTRTVRSPTVASQVPSGAIAATLALTVWPVT